MDWVYFLLSLSCFLKRTQYHSWHCYKQRYMYMYIYAIGTYVYSIPTTHSQPKSLYMAGWNNRHLDIARYAYMYQSCYINHPFTTQELRILLHKPSIYNSNNTQEAALASMLLTTHPDKWAEPVLQEVTRNKSSFINNLHNPRVGAGWCVVVVIQQTFRIASDFV